MKCKLSTSGFKVVLLNYKSVMVNAEKPENLVSWKLEQALATGF